MIFDRFAQIEPAATIANGTGTGMSKSAIVNIVASFFEPGMRIAVMQPDGTIRGYFNVSYVDNVGPRPLSRWETFWEKLRSWWSGRPERHSFGGVIYSDEMLPEGTTVGDYLVGEGQ